MRLVLAMIISLELLGCRSSKQIIYSFSSDAVVDSIVTVLKRNESKHSRGFDKAKWFCLIRNVQDGYELIVNERTGSKRSPLDKAIRHSGRVLKVSNSLILPVIFETDILSTDFKKVGAGYMNIGGYYFRIAESKGTYKIVDTRVLF